MREDGNDVDDVPVGASGAGRGEVVAQRGGAASPGKPTKQRLLITWTSTRPSA